MLRCRRLAFIISILMFWSVPAQAGDFIDTRITFAVSDDNLLAGPGETNPNSPSTSFIPGARSTLFFDNYNKRDSGFESLSHAVLYKEMPSFFKNLTTAAALVMRIDYQIRRREYRVRDAGSYITLDYDFSTNKNLRRNVQFLAFPLSSDRMRLGYSFRISWGGDLTFPRRSLQSPVPGAKLQWNYDFSSTVGMSLYGGMKTALLQQLVTKEQIEEETAYGFLGGGQFRFGNLRFEFGGAFFNKGTFFNPGVKGEPVNFYGASGQLSYSYGMPIGVSIDFRLYRNGPSYDFTFFRPEKYTPGKFSFAVSAEASFVNNLLEDPDSIGGIVNSPGIAGDLNFRMKYGFFRMHADLVYRDLGFILNNVPGFVPFQAFSGDQERGPEFFFAVGIDYFFKGPRLTLGLKGGLQFPASFRGEIPKEVRGSVDVESLIGKQIVLIRDEGDFVLLPVVDEAGNQVEILPVFSTKINLKWQISEFMALIGEVLFSVDQNETRLEKDQIDGTTQFVYTRRFVNPIRLGFNIMMQARF